MCIVSHIMTRVRLTLTIDSRVKEAAEAYRGKTGHSLSYLVENFLRQLTGLENEVLQEIQVTLKKK